MTGPQTLLYAPAIRPELMRKALGAGADGVIYDLEDAVLSSRKDEARAMLREHLGQLVTERETKRDVDSAAPPSVYVRINAVGTDHATADLQVIAESPVLSAVRVPKVSSARDVDHVVAALGSAGAHLDVHCLIENALGVEALPEITQHPRVTAVALGEADLSADLGVRDESGLVYARSRLVTAARAAGLPAPNMAVYTNVGDTDGLVASCEEGKRLGFFGRSAIHPRQIAVIRRVFRPSEDEYQRARVLVEAAAAASQDGSGAFVLPDGRFVDEPLIQSARHTVETAERFGTNE